MDDGRCEKGGRKGRRKRVREDAKVAGGRSRALFIGSVDAPRRVFLRRVGQLDTQVLMLEERVINVALWHYLPENSWHR